MDWMTWSSGDSGAARRSVSSRTALKARSQAARRSSIRPSSPLVSEDFISVDRGKTATSALDTLNSVLGETRAARAAASIGRRSQDDGSTSRQAARSSRRRDIGPPPSRDDPIPEDVVGSWICALASRSPTGVAVVEPSSALPVLWLWLTLLRSLADHVRDRLKILGGPVRHARCTLALCASEPCQHEIEVIPQVEADLRFPIHLSLKPGRQLPLRLDAGRLRRARPRHFRFDERSRAGRPEETRPQREGGGDAEHPPAAQRLALETADPPMNLAVPECAVAGGLSLPRDCVSEEASYVLLGFAPARLDERVQEAAQQPSLRVRRHESGYGLRQTGRPMDRLGEGREGGGHVLLLRIFSEPNLRRSCLLFLVLSSNVCPTALRRKEELCGAGMLRMHGQCLKFQ